MYSHPEALLCDPGDFQSIYYCIGKHKPVKGEKITASLSDSEDDDDDSDDEEDNNEDKKKG